MENIICGGKKVLLITGTTDIITPKDSDDATQEELFELTLPSKERYAKKHGYDLLVMRSFGDSSPYGFVKHNVPFPQNNQIGFLRAIVAFEMLFSYETVFWIDSDSLITNYDYDLNTFGVNSEKSFYASYDWEWKNSFSTGNFILHRTPQPQWRQLFQLFLHLGTTKFLDHLLQEQITLNYINNNIMPQSFQILEHKYLNAVPKEIENTKTWKDRRKINWPWDRSCFLAHFTGLTNTERIELIKNNFSQYI